MPVITNRPGIRSEEPDGPFTTTLVAGETRIPTPEHWRVLRPNGISGWMLHLTIAGSGLVHVAGQKQRIETGSCIFFAPQAVHDYDRAPDAELWHHRWVYFHPRPHWMPWLHSLGVIRAGLIRLVTDRKSCDLLDRDLAAIATAKTENRAMHLLEGTLLDLMETAPKSDQGILDERVRAACAWIEERLDRNLPVASVASVVGISSSRLSHLFQQHFGCGILRWRDQVRIRRARDLLTTTGIPIAVLAQQLGYSDPQYFTRIFRILVGTSPSRYRQQSGERSGKGDDT